MRDYIILNGKPSTEIKGLLIQSLPPVSKPLLRTEIEEIDGRNGSIITPLGYSAYNKELTIGLYGDFDIDEVIGYFNTSGTVTFSNEADKYYHYQISEQINFDKLIRFRTAKVIFYVQPFKFSLAETERTFEFDVTGKKGASITLETTGTALTEIQIYGSSQQNGIPTTANPVPIKVVAGINNAVFTNGVNSNAHSYNLGSLELAYLNRGVEICQDKIYKSDNKWYIRKELGKLVVDTDDITLNSTYTNVAFACIPKPTDAKGYNTTDNVPCLCTHGTYSPGLAVWDTADAKNLIFTQGNSTNYWLGFSASTTLADMKTALSGAVIYYPLATPTVSQITDSDLLVYLNALSNAETYNGVTTVRATQYTLAQPIYYASVKNQTAVIQNIGNYISNPKFTIYGSGDIVVNLNGSPVFSIVLGTEGNITIDSAEMEAYKGNVLKNRLVAGNYENFAFKVGNNALSFTGNVSKVVIENYSRWL